MGPEGEAVWRKENNIYMPEPNYDRITRKSFLLFAPHLTSQLQRQCNIVLREWWLYSGDQGGLPGHSERIACTWELLWCNLVYLFDDEVLSSRNRLPVVCPLFNPVISILLCTTGGNRRLSRVFYRVLASVHVLPVQMRTAIFFFVCRRRTQYYGDCVEKLGICLIGIHDLISWRSRGKMPHLYCQRARVRRSGKAYIRNRANCVSNLKL